MNAKNLMIGDWVMYSGQYFKVDGYFRITNTLCLKYNGKTAYYKDGTIVAEDSEPIPITAEILEKNGFDWIEDKDEFSDSEYEGYMELCSDEEIWFYPKGSMDRYCVVEIGYIERTYIRLYINYVHEIQHALRLCGLNDLADNFKVKGGEE